MSNTSRTPSLNVGELRRAYQRGENIAKLLRERYTHLSTPEIIEFSYDIQAGSYTMQADNNPEALIDYAAQIFAFCKEHIGARDSVLDCGTGELTTLSALSHHLPREVKLLAFDISLNRIRFGQQFCSRMMREDLARDLRVFTADMARIPLAAKSVDVVITMHSLEPNHGHERELLIELLRVTRQKLILFEPSWEESSEEVRARMRDHGYVRNLPSHIDAADGQLISVSALPHPLNPLNPTYCFVIEPNRQAFAQHTSVSSQRELQEFLCPRSSSPLRRRLGYWWSAEGGWAYPEIEGVPCLRERNAILMSCE